MGIDVGKGVGGRGVEVGTAVSVAVGGIGVFVEGTSVSADLFWLQFVTIRKQNRIMRAYLIR
jgi:hypothetical protein